MNQKLEQWKLRLSRLGPHLATLSVTHAQSMARHAQVEADAAAEAYRTLWPNLATKQEEMIYDTTGN